MGFALLYPSDNSLVKSNGNPVQKRLLDFADFLKKTIMAELHRHFGRSPRDVADSIFPHFPGRVGDAANGLADGIANVLPRCDAAR